MEYQNILSQVKQQILYVTVNRPHKLNALNKQTLAELADVIEFAGKNKEVRGVLLTGIGEKAFVAGADIAEFLEYTPAQGEALARNGQKILFDEIESCPKPVVAAINGFALGGGLELAMSCHIRVASQNAKLGLPEVLLGLIPGYGGTQRLTQLVGKGRAMELITTGELISAEKAERFGLVNHVVDQSELISCAENILNKIISRAPLAVAGAIRSINAATKFDVDGYETEITVFGECFGTADFKEGTAAFIGKRNPIFTGT